MHTLSNIYTYLYYTALIKFFLIGSGSFYKYLIQEFCEGHVGLQTLIAQLL